MAAAIFTLHTNDSILLGKVSFAFIADQTVGKDYRFLGGRNTVKPFPVIGIGDAG